MEVGRQWDVACRECGRFQIMAGWRNKGRVEIDRGVGVSPSKVRREKKGGGGDSKGKNQY